MTKKHHLLDDFEDNPYLFYGIRKTSLAEYLWIFRMNEIFGLQWYRVENLCLKLSHQDFEFSQYWSRNPEEEGHLKLYGNDSIPQMQKSIENQLFKEEIIQRPILKNNNKYSFILQTNLPLNEEFLLHLRSNSNILYLQELSEAETKIIQNLIV